jgi:hypothetical protein
VLALDSSYGDAFRLLSAMRSEEISVSIPKMDPKLPRTTTSYSPTVIPVVKSLRSMVIVGAILREDMERAVARLKKIIDVGNRPPVIRSIVLRTAISSNLTINYVFQVVLGRYSVEGDLEDGESRNEYSYASRQVLESVFMTQQEEIPRSLESSNPSHATTSEASPALQIYDSEEENRRQILDDAPQMNEVGAALSKVLSLCSPTSLTLSLYR